MMIKCMFINVVEIINRLYLNITTPSVSMKGTRFYRGSIHSSHSNAICIENSHLKNSRIVIDGRKNYVNIDNAEVSETLITIKGINNKIIVGKGVKLCKTTLVIRGTHCTVSIGTGTTFGEIRIVNVGKDNAIAIGENCLFADNIELWASDTHSIYDENGIFLNPERPIVIGNNVWIGSYVKILKGVTISDGAIIGMNTLVTKDVASRTLNVGNPMRCLKENVSWALNYENE